MPELLESERLDDSEVGVFSQLSASEKYSDQQAFLRLSRHSSVPTRQFRALRLRQLLQKRLLLDSLSSLVSVETDD